MLTSHPHVSHWVEEGVSTAGGSWGQLCVCKTTTQQELNVGWVFALPHVTDWPLLTQSVSHRNHFAKEKMERGRLKSSGKSQMGVERRVQPQSGVRGCRAGHTGLVTSSDTVLVSLGCLRAWMARHTMLHPRAVSTLLQQEVRVCPGRRDSQSHPSSPLAFGCAGCSSSPRGKLWADCIAVAQPHGPEPTQDLL